MWHSVLGFVFPVISKDRAVYRQRSNGPRGIPAPFDPGELMHYFSQNIGRRPPQRRSTTSERTRILKFALDFAKTEYSTSLLRLNMYEGTRYLDKQACKE